MHGGRTAACCCGRSTATGRCRVPISPRSPGSPGRRSAPSCATSWTTSSSRSSGSAPPAGSASRPRSSTSPPTAATSCASTCPSRPASSAPSSTSPARWSCAGRTTARTARAAAPSRSSGGSAASWSPMPSVPCSASASPAPASSTPSGSSSPPPTSAGPASRSAPTLADEFDLPVAVVNDANAAALAELTFGDETASNLICVRVDEGVGAGLVLDGRLFAGRRTPPARSATSWSSRTGACARAASAAAWRPRSRRRSSPDGSRPPQATALPCCSAPASTSARRWRPCSAPSTSPTSCSPGTGAVATETFRLAAAGSIAARTMPVLGDRLVVRASTFGFDDILVGAAARVLDQELGIR